MIKGFSLDIYDSDISFAWDTNEKEINAFFDKIEATEEYRALFWEHYNDKKMGALTTVYSVTNVFCYFGCEPNNKLVAHEIYHIAYNILHPRGIEDEEAWAYLIGYLTEMLYDLYLEKSDGDIQDEQYSPSTPVCIGGQVYDLLEQAPNGVEAPEYREVSY